MNLRPAIWEDGDLLFQWRNDPVTVRSLPGARPVLREEHEDWMSARVQQPHLYVAEEAGDPLGTVRLDPCFIISVTIAPQHRGRGWATPVILAATNYADDQPVLAQVLLNNQASIRAFLKAGFRLEPGQWYKK